MTSKNSLNGRNGQGQDEGTKTRDVVLFKYSFVGTGTDLLEYLFAAMDKKLIWRLQVSSRNVDVDGGGWVPPKADDPPKQANAVRALLTAMAKGYKIEAIKEFRELTGDGLKESKDAVDAVYRAAAA